MRKRMVWFGLICFFAVSGVFLMAAPGYTGMGNLRMPPGKWWRMPETAKKLKLTPDEQKTLDKRFVENRRKLIDLKANLEKKRFELEVTLDKKEFDESSCINQFKKVEEARADLATERFRFILEIRKLLGYDRFKELKENYDRRPRRMGRDRDRRPAMKRSGNEARPMKNKNTSDE